MENGDSGGDKHPDGGSDRNGYDIVHGPRAVLRVKN